MTDIQKDEFGRDLKYESPSIEGHETAVKNRVISFADYILANKTDEEKRQLLGIAMEGLHLAVDYVMSNLPTGVDRVDGKVIRPILKQVVQEKLAELPEPETTEEI